MIARRLPPGWGGILLRILSLVLLSFLFALGLGLAWRSVFVATFSLCSILALHALILIWQENSLLLRVNTKIKFLPHQAAQMAALKAQVREHCRRLGLKRTPLVYWRNSPEQQLLGYRSLGSPGFILVDQDLFSVWSDARWHLELTRALMELSCFRSLLFSFGAWWLGLGLFRVSDDDLNGKSRGVLRGWKWVLTLPARRFFIWFQMN